MAEINETHCCALYQLNANNDDNIRDIKRTICENAIEPDFYDPESIYCTFTTLFCVIAPFEKTLETRLKKIGFKKNITFKSNDNYSLKMYILRINKRKILKMAKDVNYVF